MSLQRRSLLASIAAAPLLSSWPAGAQQAVAQAQAPGFYRFRVGRFLVTTITDGQAMRANPTRGMVVNAEPAAVEQVLKDALRGGSGRLTTSVSRRPISLGCCPTRLEGCRQGLRAVVGG